MAQQPRMGDRFVRVSAFLTDEVFGYEHWRAAQFASPDVPTKRPAVLIVCRDEQEQREALAFLQARDTATAEKDA